MNDFETIKIFAMQLRNIALYKFNIAMFYMYIYQIRQKNLYFRYRQMESNGA